MRVLFSIALGVGTVLTALSADAQTLFTYGPNQVSKEEFLRVYQKNNAQKKPDFSAKSVNEYLDLYSLFRMKVKEAEQMRLDTTEAVKSELANYKGQLARTYLSDKEVTKTLVRQAYDRSKEEIKVSHILLAVRPNEDTTNTYKKIDSIYNAINSGKASFEELAKQYSDDKTSGANGGSIGYISALQVVYPFESVAYSTAVGKVSKPFRTQFGFHILKVEDKRKANGQVQVAQIMVANTKAKGAEGLAVAEKKMATIQAELKAGASFADLAKKYSDDKFSKDNGGVMEPFGVGKLMPAFEAAAFALKNPGDVAAPVQTDYGIHLIKLVNKIPLQPLDSIQDQLTRRVENDSRAMVAKEAYQEKVKKQYGFKEYRENLTPVIAALPADTAKDKTFKAENFKSYTANLFELGGKKYTQSDFIKYAADLTRGNLVGNKNTAIPDLLKMYQTSLLNDLQQSDLEKNNVEFKNLITEYRDGILLFDLMDKNVWTKASKDTAGLALFYNQNKEKYKWQPGFEGTVYQAVSDIDLKKLETALNSGTDATEALNAINTADNPSGITQQAGRYEFNRFPIDKSNFKEGKSTYVYKNDDGTFSLVFPSKIYSNAEVKALEEAKGFAVADYQDFLEKQWNQDLRAKYPMKVEQKQLSSIIK